MFKQIYDLQMRPIIKLYPKLIIIETVYNLKCQKQYRYQKRICIAY
jgi:hypothetical protein